MKQAKPLEEGFVAIEKNSFLNSIIETAQLSFANPANDIFHILNRIINCVPGYAHIKSANDLSYLLVNQLTLDLYKINSPNEIIGKNIYDVAKHLGKRWPLHYAEEIDSYEQNVLKNKSPILSLEEKPYLNENNRIIINSLNKFPLLSRQGEAIGLFTLAYDVTHLQNLQKIRSMYFQLWPDRSLAHKKFLSHIDFYKYLNNKNITVTEREFDCFLLYCKGKTAKEAARELKISPKTFDAHMESIKEKLISRKKSALLEIFHEIYFFQKPRSS